MEPVDQLKSTFRISHALAKEILSRQSVVLYSKGSVIQRQGYSPGHLYFVLSGLCVYTADEDIAFFQGLAFDGMLLNDMSFMERDTSVYDHRLDRLPVD